jgi:hypothetical protein
MSWKINELESMIMFKLGGCVGVFAEQICVINNCYQLNIQKRHTQANTGKL